MNDDGKHTCASFGRSYFLVNIFLLFYSEVILVIHKLCWRWRERGLTKYPYTPYLVKWSTKGRGKGVQKCPKNCPHCLWMSQWASLNLYPYPVPNMNSKYFPRLFNVWGFFLLKIGIILSGTQWKTF